MSMCAVPISRIRRDSSIGPAPASASPVFGLPIHTETRRDDFIHGDQYDGSSTVDAPRPFAPLVISGGTGCNAICFGFGSAASYVLPVSDNGGSSAEIIRCIGTVL